MVEAEKLSGRRTVVVRKKVVAAGDQRITVSAFLGQIGNGIIGPNATIKQMYSTYGNVCKGCNNKITLTLSEADCCTASSAAQVSLSYKLMYCVLTQVGVSIAAQDMIINESCQIMFSGLQYE